MGPVERLLSPVGEFGLALCVLDRDVGDSTRTICLAMQQCLAGSASKTDGLRFDVWDDNGR